MRMPFGKHKGEDIEDIEDGYLEWLLNLETLNDSLRSAINNELRMRNGHAPQPKPKAIPVSVADVWRRRMASKCHPDAGGSHEKMVAVNLGYELLTEILNSYK